LTVYTTTFGLIPLKFYLLKRKTKRI